MNRKYHCPKHVEKTPSAVAYSTGYYCFGCGAKGPLSDLGVAAGERIEITYVEDIAATLAYIETLPRKLIRGFNLPYNDRGYFLVYPDRSYYKLRLSVGDNSGNKYRGPSGHKKPKFIAQDGNTSDHLVLVEGEFNALSLAALEPSAVVISPGAAGDFYSKSRALDLQYYAKFSKVSLVVDDDAAGLQAAIECSAQLKVLGCTSVKAYFVNKDFNDVFTETGKEGLKAEVDRMGLFSRV